MKFNKYPQRDPVKNYFLTPSEIFCLGLCPGEFAVYSYLLRCENRKTYQCYPSYRAIGSALKISKNTVKTYVAMLEEKGFFTTEYTQVLMENGLKVNGNLKYTIRPIAEVIDYYHQRQLEKAAHEQAKAEAKRRLEEYDRKRSYRVG